METKYHPPFYAVTILGRGPLEADADGVRNWEEPFETALDGNVWWVRIGNQRYPVSQADAWNKDVFAGLPVLVELRGKTITIVRRLKNNKKFIQI